VKEKYTCPDCGNEYERIATHWHSADCQPKMSKRQKEIVEGIFMGDAWLETDSKKPRISITMINEEYLKYLHKELKPYSNGVRMKNTAKKSAEHAKNVLGTTGKEKNYSNLYRMNMSTQSYFEKYKNWYNKNSTKIFPKGLELTPLKLKHWFVCDGCFQLSNGTTPYLTIGISDQIGQENRIRNMFSNIGIDIGHFNTGERPEMGTQFLNVFFNKDSTMEIFDYIGEAPPGFEYKFPKRFGGEVEVNL